MEIYFEVTKTCYIYFPQIFFIILMILNFIQYDTVPVAGTV